MEFDKIGTKFLCQCHGWINLLSQFLDRQSMFQLPTSLRDGPQDEIPAASPHLMGVVFAAVVDLGMRMMWM
jgi:hypothetical protein